MIGLWRDLGFASPIWFAALALLPLLWWLRRRRRVAAVRFARVDLLLKGPRAGKWLRRVRTALRIIAIVTATVALARPQSGARADSAHGEGIDIMLVQDISSSMLAEDFQPLNRLAVAKERLKGFIRGRKDDRIGLVSFAGEALTQVPLTVDYPILMNAVDNLEAGAGQLEDGTAIGTAIATAANRLRNAGGRSRVMLLLTDGENNRGAIDPRTAAQAAGAFNIRIYAIGVGSEGNAPIPVSRGVFGLRYENRPVRIDETLLEDIARNTGGRYFRARDAASLQQIYNQIDQLERSPTRVARYRPFIDEYRWPLSIALGALVIELMLLAWRGPLP
ncbi:MAG TPA: VWA domain-containing protein [Gemmatimonadaceae bacterium]|nr:VWA domain-containing protein [Gemmatimonadaceae bacterium]